MPSVPVELVAKLKELFRLDQPDLDFGVYRIMRAKSAEVTAFLERDLPSEVHAAFARHETTVDKAALEADVYDHLHRFFRRYYAEGDFLANRVYKAGVYAIPYEGEEVKLHWANRDQYYVKTNAYLRDYAFRTAAGRVHFRLIDATEGEHDNVKVRAAAERVFVLAPAGASGHAFLSTVRDGDEELTIDFEYRPAQLSDWHDGTGTSKAKPPTQKDLVAIGARRILAVTEPSLTTWVASLGSELDVHLRRYTARNTFDSFIHKDLGSFLRRELDFYIKNEVMLLDDIESETAPRVEQYLSEIKVIRRIAWKVIEILDQIERFQKKLWLKKKLVVETRYLVALGAIPEALHEDVAKNEAQLREWVKLCSIDEPLPVSFVRAHPSLMIDTGHFDAAFTARLLEALSGSDGLEPDGVLIHSENFQALQLVSRSLKGRVGCVYIDPPYNAKTSEILYKNTFKHSSWLSLMHDRVSAARTLLNEDGVFVCAIDENEQERLGLLLEEIFPGSDRTCVSVVHNPRGIQGSGFSYTHEYAYFVHRPGLALGRHVLESAKSKPLMKTGSESERATAKNCFYPIYVRGGKVTRFGDVAADGWSPPSATVRLPDGEIEVWPISSTDDKERKWRYARQSVDDVREQLEVKSSRAGEPTINLAKDEEAYRTVWAEAEFNAAEHGSTLLRNIITDGEFSFPKSLWTVYHSLKVARVKGTETIVDFFGGSGTTAHAVIHMNREDGGKRRFVLAEMGAYFDTVLLPRIKKVSFAPEWTEGRPERLATAAEAARSPQVVKVLRLESYEDTLNNLETRRTTEQEALLASAEAREPGGFAERYLLRYMLDFETRGSKSLLDVKAFADPTAYALNVKRPGKSESRVTNVDLLETFNWLLGLRATRIAAPQTFAATFERDAQSRICHRGGLEANAAGKWWLRSVTGTTPEGRKALVIWRNLTASAEEDNLVLDAWFAERAFASRGLDLVYVNGSCNIEGARLLEEHFQRLMFDADGV